MQTRQLRESLGAWAVVLVLILAAAIPSTAEALVFRGCFASGPDTDGTADGDLDMRVDALTGALVGTGSWRAANAKKLKNANRAAIEACIIGEVGMS